MFAPSFSLPSGQNPKIQTGIYKKWLEEDVVYIITAKEREVFLQLETSRERDLFIEAFWRHRDPNQITERNEFKEEHFRRIEYANRQYGRTSSVPGWKTDRGRIYILLGPPISIHRFDSSQSVHPSEIWFYQGLEKYGLPGAFNIVFFKKRGTGDYRLYSPSMDGPVSLVAGSAEAQVDSRRAYQEILAEEPLLAQASLSLLPDEKSSPDFPSLASERLLLDVRLAPQKRVEDRYSEMFLRYKDIIEVEYSTNYIGNDALVFIIPDNSGKHFIHYQVELDRFSVNQYEELYMTKVLINGNVSDTQGRTVFQFERSLPVEFDQEQHDKVKTQRFGVQDVFPMIEGKYRLRLLVKNDSSKEFSSLEKEIVIPHIPDPLSPLILAYKVEGNTETDKMRAFQAGELHIYPAVKKEFSTQDSMAVFSKVSGGSKDIRREKMVNFIFKKGEEIFRRDSREFEPSDSSGFVWAEFPLYDFPPSYYELEVSLMDENGSQLAMQKENFSVSPVKGIPRPWIHTIVHESPGAAIYNLIYGQQYMNIDEFEKAKVQFETAYQQNPSSLTSAGDLARALFALNKYQEVIELLTPFSKQENDLHLELLGRSSLMLKRYKEALSIYEDLIRRHGGNFARYAMVGECHYRLGNLAEALKAWETSLKINPNQEELKKFVDRLKKRQ